MNENSISNWKTIVDKPVNGNSLGRIDQYELIRELGGGGFGCVYLARDTVAGIDVAVKGLPPLVRLNKEELENVRKNFALVSRLHHPNIAAALTLHPVTNAFYNDKTDAEKLRVFSGDTLVVMQYAPGVTLSQWRKQFPDGKVPLDKAIEITRQIAFALDYAHKERIIHRDIKPANVMVETLPDRSVTARVLDFGLAAEIRSSMGRLSLNVTDKSGTRHYMAPEQWSGKKQSKETDQYSLAALFYELILGEVPFASVFDTGDTVLMKTVVENDSPEIPHDLPKSVRLALAKALSKKREDRFASCIEFVDALQDGLISGARASSPGGRASSRAVAILAAVAALGIAFGGIWYWQSAKSEAEVSQKTAIVRDIEEEKRLCDDEIERQFSVRHHCDYVEGLRDEARSQIFKAYPGFMDNLKKMTLRERCRIAFLLSAFSCKRSISFVLDEKLLDVNDVGNGGFLHLAAWACDKDMIDFLIARGADVNKQDEDGQSPISFASSDGAHAHGISMIKYLIERHGARIVNVNDDESLFMDLAGLPNFQEGAKYLIEERSYVPTSAELQKLGEKDKAYIESLLKKRPGLEMLKKEKTGPRRGDRKTLRLPGGETMTMIYVAPGSFMMGSPSSEEGRSDAETQHHVTLTKGYWLGETEVTQAQWESVMGNNPSYFKGASRPVEQVSWKDCQEFIAKVNREARRQLGGEARLPTEAEWEYACRAGTQTAYSWGNSLNGDKANCDGNYPYGTAIRGPYKKETVNVRSYSPNPWGFYDMHGNVCEWCQDWYGAYPSGAVTDPKGQASGSGRVQRGGFYVNDALSCRSASRGRYSPSYGYSSYGFRLCCSAGPREDSEVNDVVEPHKAEQDDVKRVQLWEECPYWATRNIGADKPEDYGYYFWWGDTVGYKREGDKWVASDGSNSNFEFRDSNTPTYGKSVLDLRSEGWITADCVLSPQHDAAQKHWGGDWRMPTKMELDDLVNKCDWRRTQVNGVNGCVVRGKGEYSSKSIFLPCAGRGNGASLRDAGSYGDCWSSVPYSDYYYSWYLNFYSSNHYTGSHYYRRYYGRSVRPLQGFTK